MLSARAILVFIHVFANLIWIGSITSVGFVLMQASVAREARTGVSLALYRRVATPAFGVSFLTGALRLGLDANYYFVQTHYMHGKLLFAVLVIALHHVIGARARKAAAETTKDSGNVAVLTAVLLACAGAAVFFVVLKPSL